MESQLLAGHIRIMLIKATAADGAPGRGRDVATGVVDLKTTGGGVKSTHYSQVSIIGDS